MDNKALKIFRATIIGMLLLCALVFGFITIYDKTEYQYIKSSR